MTASTVNGKSVGPVGFGMMNLTWREKPIPDEQAFATLKAALAAGANLWNAGDFYGPPEANSLQLLNRYFTKHPEDAERVVLTIKGGYNFAKHAPDTTPEGIRNSIDTCLRVLDGKKFLDVWEPARQDLNVSPREVIDAVKPYIESHKIGGMGLSEVTSEQVKSYAKLHSPISVVEIELSLHTPNVLDNGVVATCGELNIPILAYSPLGRGLLTGSIRSKADLDTTDIRHRLPRFSEDNLSKNASIADELQKIASKKGNATSPAQIAIAWVQAWSGRKGFGAVVPIPGSTTAERATENCHAVALTEPEFQEIEDIRRRSEVVGGRYPGQ